MFTVTVAQGAQPLTRVPIQCGQYGDVRRYRAGGDDAPSGAQGALSYSAMAPAVCTVDPGPAAR